jgi:alanine-glyoxylate transaminase/serine-glyoxylate transaminase/serine-pyruvate transaminase
VDADRPLLMIPGPIEISEAVFLATCRRPASHVAPELIRAFGHALRMMRQVWLADDHSLPFLVAGGGTLAMESAACNLTEPGDRALVVNTGYFGDRMGEMLSRRGVEVVHLRSEVGAVPDPAEVQAALATRGPFKVLFATHVDTSTGARTDPQRLAALARAHGALSCFDGVCATAGERFEQQAWEADLYFTASQKAIGLPPGLGLWVAGPRALAARQALRTPPPLTLDWLAWAPVMQAYLEQRPAYFSTPATSLVPALEVGLAEILARGPTPAAAMEATFARHQRAADAMRAGWSALGLRSLCARPEHAANTLSALLYPEGVDATVLPRIAAHGAIVAGGLHPACRDRYFRVGHMGETAGRPADLLRTLGAVGRGLADAGHRADVEGALAAAAGILGA